MIETPKPEPTNNTSSEDDDILEPDQVAFDAAETAFMQNAVENEDAGK